MGTDIIKPDLPLSQFQLIQMDLLEANEGQLDGLPANPREIHESKFELLKQDIMAHPEYLKYNMLKVYPLDNGHFIIIGGNMRFRAMLDLGFSAAPCAIIDPATDIESLKAYTILDNAAFGKWEWSMLANEWDANQLTGWGLDLPVMESDIDVDDFFDNIDKENEKDKGDKITITLPDNLAEEKAQIKDLIESALSDYEGIKVK